MIGNIVFEHYQLAPEKVSQYKLPCWYPQKMHNKFPNANLIGHRAVLIGFVLLGQLTNLPKSYLLGLSVMFI